MKIGLIKHRYIPEGGGSERYTNGLVDGLLNLGHEVHVFAGHALPNDRVTIHKVRVFRGASFLRQWHFAKSCKKTIQRAPCDLLFSLERTIRQDIVRAGGGCHREYLIHCQRYLPALRRLGLRFSLLHPTLLRLERQTFCERNTKVVIANSRRGKDEILRHYSFPPRAIEVIHNGTDLERFKPHVPAASDKVVLLFVGSGFERKGLGFAIRALAKLPADVELRIAGKGNTAPYLRLANKLGVESRIRFLGVQTRIEDIYAQGDVLVHPAIYEPFSNACLEAMACGLPVVTTRMNGASEVIVHGENGATVEEPDNIEALATAIGTFCELKSRREASAQARKTAETLPMSLNVDKTLQVIRRTLGGS